MNAYTEVKKKGHKSYQCNKYFNMNSNSTQTRKPRVCTVSKIFRVDCEILCY